MNKADSERLSAALDHMGLYSTHMPREADLVILNSCVVRQSAEDKVTGTLGLMKSVKRRRPGQLLALTGCLVGPRDDVMRARFPDVDVFMRPQQYTPLFDLLEERMGMNVEGCLSNLAPSNPDICSYVPVIHGCDLMCTFCIIPFRRGRQVSRPMTEVVQEIQLMVQRGMREVTLLGQTVDAYGHDLPGRSDLADLLHEVSAVEGLARIRFLTSHPIFMTDRIMSAVNDIDKVCEQVLLPVQSSNDDVLASMRRRYTEDAYRKLIERMRRLIPGVSIGTDVIVGFPGETRKQFQNTLDLLKDIEFDKVHIAGYSPRPGTYAHRKLIDDVPLEEKKDRVATLEAAQKSILEKNNARLLGRTMEVLVEGRKNTRWKGRTRSDKLVFFDQDEDVTGNLVNVRIDSTGPWALQGIGVV